MKKNQHSICWYSIALGKKKKDDGEVKNTSEPTEPISDPFLGKKRTHKRPMRLGLHPNTHRHGVEQPIRI